MAAISEHTHRPSHHCQTMAEVRREIDRIDRLLVQLLAERQSYIEAAARIKADREQIYDPARIEEVIGKILDQARKQGLSPAIAEPVWRTLIEKSIAHEFAAYDHAKADKI